MPRKKQTAETPPAHSYVSSIPDAKMLQNVVRLEQKSAELADRFFHIMPKYCRDPERPARPTDELGCLYQAAMRGVAAVRSAIESLRATVAESVAESACVSDLPVSDQQAPGNVAGQAEVN